MLTIDLTGQVALVTGALGGIGTGIVSVLAQAGCCVAASDLDDADTLRVRSCLEEVGRFSDRATYCQADLQKPNDIKALVDDVGNRHGSIDMVVSNAGVNCFSGLANCTREQWQENLDINLTTHWLLTQACYPYLCASKTGLIVVMSSNHANHTLSGCFPYNVAKAGLNALVQSLTIEWGPKIRAVGIAPGFIDTPNNDRWFALHDQPEEKRRMIEQLHPAGRMGQPKEIGWLCAYLASSAASFISGTTLIVDGGRSAVMMDL